MTGKMVLSETEGTAGLSMAPEGRDIKRWDWRNKWVRNLNVKEHRLVRKILLILFH